MRNCINVSQKNNLVLIKLSDDADFKDTVLGNSKLTIRSYEIANKFKEKYNYCIEDKCNTAVYSIAPKSNNKGGLSVLKLQTSLNMDKTVYVNKFITYPEDLLNYYKKSGKYKTTSLNKLDVDIEKNEYAYFEIPSELENATKIELILLIRGIKYTFVLK